MRDTMDCGEREWKGLNMDWLLPNFIPEPTDVAKANADKVHEVYSGILRAEAAFIDGVMKQHLPREIYEAAHIGTIEGKRKAVDWLAAEGWRMEVWPDRRRVCKKDRVIAEMRVEFKA